MHGGINVRIKVTEDLHSRLMCEGIYRVCTFTEAVRSAVEEGIGVLEKLRGPRGTPQVSYVPPGDIQIRMKVTADMHARLRDEADYCQFSLEEAFMSALDVGITQLEQNHVRADAPEVCDCHYRDGKLFRMCSKCQHVAAAKMLTNNRMLLARG